MKRQYKKIIVLDEGAVTMSLISEKTDIPIYRINEFLIAQGIFLGPNDVIEKQALVLQILKHFGYA